MEFPYGTPFNDGGSKQPKLHTKQYLYIQDDHHHSVDNREGNPEGGILCQDCHTTNAVHGNGNISTTTLANVEIECSDCHGTPDRYPWELPFGFGDEFGEKTQTGHEPEISVKPTPETPPDKRVDSPDLRPSMKGRTGPIPYPKPINL